MRKYKIFLPVLFSLGIINAQVTTTKDACISCHEEIDEDREADEKIMTNIYDDIHLRIGLGCVGCHGGDPEAFDDEDESMWDNETFRGKIERTEQPEACGTCHGDPSFMRQYSATVKTDQVKQFWTSQHGIELKKGSEKSAVCIDCHGVHGIYPVKDPRSLVYPINVPSTCSQCHSDADYMAEFDIPTDQFYKYRTSVHGQALLDQQRINAPACNDCHGNHGALPPDVVHLTDICGTCHVNNNILFQKSHLNNIFLKRGFGQCEACHGNHGIKSPTDEYLNWEHGAVCVQCHKNTGNPKILADQFYLTLNNLKDRIDLALQQVTKAEQKGMEVSDLFFPLEEAHKVLIQTRTSIHSFNNDFVNETAANGFKSADVAIEGAMAALAEFDRRRRWLFIISLAITFFAATLYLKIKEIDERN